MANNAKTEAARARIEAGQILNPECFPFPNELVCIHVPKVFDQVSLRECVTTTVKLESCASHPKFAFEGTGNFDIVEVRVVQETDSLNRPGFKKLKLLVKIKYTVYFSDGVEQKEQEAFVYFPLTINEIYCPNCLTQIGVIRYPNDNNNNHHHHGPKNIDVDGQIIKVEAIADTFNDSIKDNKLTIDVGAFFIVKCECIVQLLIPAYGYCPVPPEQQNAAAQNCNTFNDRTRTPFPTSFFPEQKWNPLDNVKKDNWE